MAIRIGIIGFGYWGPKLFRNFAHSGQFEVVAIADPRVDATRSLLRLPNAPAVVGEAAELLARDDIDAVAVATPVATHYDFVAAALDRGKHVLVEKPMCRTSAEADDLVARAERSRCVLMVDHTFLFTGAVQTMARLIKSGELGEICYFDSMRINLGLFQPDVNCLWDLGPHDLSIIDHCVDCEVLDLDVSAYCHVNAHSPDLVYMTVYYTNRMIAHFNLSWMSPVKVRRFAVGGTKQMLIWDDLDQDQKIKIYNSGISFQKEDQRNMIIPDYRIGDIWSPRVPTHEALGKVVDHFAHVIQGREEPIMSGRHGARVVRLLERAQTQIDRRLDRLSQLENPLVTRRTLVTGGGGFIGSHLVDILIARGEHVTVLDDFSVGSRDNLESAASTGKLEIVEGSILDRRSVERSLEDCSIVYHLAVQCVRRSLGLPIESHDVNATGTLTVLDASRTRGIERFVYCSSSEVYGNGSADILDEETSPLRPATVYGAAKLAGELYTDAFRITYGLPTIIVRPFNAYGPRAHMTGVRAEVLPRFVVRVANGQAPVIFGSGRNGRDFTYVTEVARGLALAGETDRAVGKRINIAFGEMITIEEVARAVLKAGGRNDLTVEHTDPRPGDVEVLRAGTQRARDILGYRAEIDFDTGLELFLRWFRDAYPEPRALVEREVRNWQMPASSTAAVRR